MAKVHVVHVPFVREHPTTGMRIEYQRGDIIADPDVLDDLADTEHHTHGRAAELPDDHHAVLPYLPDDHPLKRPTDTAEPARSRRAAAPDSE